MRSLNSMRGGGSLVDGGSGFALGSTRLALRLS
jgi:hypothetical protein